MLKAEMEWVQEIARSIAKEELAKAFKGDTPLAKDEAKEAAREARAEAKAADEPLPDHALEGLNFAGVLQQLVGRVAQSDQLLREEAAKNE